MNKIKFAILIGFIERAIANSISLSEHQVSLIDSMINEGVEQPKISIEQTKIYTSELNRLLHLMQQGQAKIEAIKSYRTLTGEGLKESKDVVEKYLHKDWRHDFSKIQKALDTECIGDDLIKVAADAHMMEFELSMFFTNIEQKGISVEDAYRTLRIRLGR